MSTSPDERRPFQVTKLTGTAATMDSPNLLALPFEIREVILRELLRNAECDGQLPLFLSGPPPKVAPAILSSCRQLFEEGTRLLYSHTLHFEILPMARTYPRSWRPSYGIQPIYLGRTFTNDTIPPAIMKRASTVNIQLNAWPAGCAVSMHMQCSIQDQVRQLSKLIERNPHWQHFTLRAYTSIGTPLHGAPEVRPLEIQPFHPLVRLRQRSSVAFDGVDPHFAIKLTETITSTAPLIDIDGMYEELEALVAALQPPPPKTAGGKRRTETDFAGVRYSQRHHQLQSSLRNHAALKRNNGDQPGFLAVRLRLVRKLKELFEENQSNGAGAQAIQGDPAWIGQEIARLLAAQDEDALPTIRRPSEESTHVEHM